MSVACGTLLEFNFKVNLKSKLNKGREDEAALAYPTHISNSRFDSKNSRMIIIYLKCLY